MSEHVVDIERSHWNALRQGDSRALAWLYDRYFKLLYNYGRKLNVDTKSVEDAIHDLFVDLWRFRSNLAPTTSVRFYLYRSLRRRLVRNNALDSFLLNNQSLEGEGYNVVPSKEQDLIEKETDDLRIQQLQKMLNDLSPRQYEAMVLRFYDELSFEEIGGILDVNEQSARNLVQRGLAQLKQYSKLLLTFIGVLLASVFGW